MVSEKLTKLAVVTGTVGVNSDDTSINQVIYNALTDLIVPAAAAIAVGAIIYSGVLYMVSAGDPEKISKAKKNLMWSVIAIFILALSYLIVESIVDTVDTQIIK